MGLLISASLGLSDIKSLVLVLIGNQNQCIIKTYMTTTRQNDITLTFTISFHLTLVNYINKHEHEQLKVVVLLTKVKKKFNYLTIVQLGPYCKVLT